MADINYNPGVQRPQTDIPGLSGLWGAQDRQAYNQQTALGQMMNTHKASEYLQDAPVRESKRLADVATHNATADTVGEQKRGDVTKTQLQNDFDRQTLGPRVGQRVAEAALAEQGAGLQKLQQGLGYATMMMQALGQYGPAGASHVLQQLRQKGINVQNDPVVNYVMSSGNPAEMQQRIQQVHQSFSMADQQYRTALMQQQEQTNRALLQANSNIDVAYARQPGEKEHDDTIKRFEAEIKENNPTWSQARVQAEAVRAFQRGKYGAQKPEDTATRAEATKLAERHHIWHLTQGRLGTRPANMVEGAKPYNEALEVLRKSPTDANKKYFKDTYGVDAESALNYGK